MPGAPGRSCSNICFNSARRRRGIDQLRINRLETVARRQFAEIDRAIGGLFALRPAAQAAEIVVVDLVDRERPRVSVTLILRGLLAQTKFGLRIGGNRLEVLNPAGKCWFFEAS
jgi:hypothetical protein